MSNLYRYGAVAIALLLAIVVNVYACHRQAEARYAAGVKDGRAAVLADDARAAAQLYQQRDQLAAYSALATGTLQQTLDTQLPAIQAATHDTAETIRTVYRDRPVPADACSRPDGVQQALDASVRRANAAASGRL